ncbi:MAG: amidohydrolase family protein [bacterium]
MEFSARVFSDSVWPELKARLVDIHGRRLELMDKHGIGMAFLSLNSPGIQAIADPARAEEIARRANDFLAEQVGRRPDRFQAFAALPMQEPDRAARELERCVEELGFKGALVNGFSQIADPERPLYYDQPQYRPFWEVVERLDVPFYLHPRNPVPGRTQNYEGQPWLLGATWAFGQETAVHALRLMGSGLFDQYPRLNIILGHLGEGLPFNLWRIDHHNAWTKAPPKYPAKRQIAEYFRRNFYLTTSGNFHLPALVMAMMEIGVERILFSVDWPFENIDHGAEWFDGAAINEADRLQIGRLNAAGLFKLDLS